MIAEEEIRGGTPSVTIEILVEGSDGTPLQRVAVTAAVAPLAFKPPRVQTPPDDMGYD
jgi:hypothetical protein